MKHPIQQKLIELSKSRDLRKMKLRDIGELIGIDNPHPQRIKYHMQKIGILEHSKNTSVKKNTTIDKIVSLPIMGTANCGDATMFAENLIDGYLPISRRLLPSKYNTDHLFIVRASGDSMNDADINDKDIQDGDFIVIDESDKTASDGDYVLSIINGMANVKRYTEDTQNEHIILESESRKFFPPIYIHKDDIDDYLINGKVIDVIKKPRPQDDLTYENIYD